MHLARWLGAGKKERKALQAFIAGVREGGPDRKRTAPARQARERRLLWPRLRSAGRCTACRRGRVPMIGL